LSLHYQIGIAGSGKVAFAIGQKLANQNQRVAYIYSRNSQTGQHLAESIGAQYVSNFVNAHQITKVDIWILAVSDDAIVDLGNELSYFFPDALFLHCSGAFETSLLSSATQRYGILYPLQSFSHSVKVDFSSIYIFIDTNREEDLYLLKVLASHLSPNIQRISESQRQGMHLAAVFANNFSNLMYRITEEISRENGLKFEIFLPLIFETSNKLNQTDPHKAQTGPADRHDNNTIDKHLKILEQYPESFSEVYRICTRIIQNFPNKKT
jgi:predicted short-subunit dehydrogenase-like oxidoreductase (DUF2520 family)